MRYNYQKYLEKDLFPIRKNYISSQFIFEMIENREIGHNTPYIQFSLPICNMCFEPAFQNLDVL